MPPDKAYTPSHARHGSTGSLESSGFRPRRRNASRQMNHYNLKKAKLARLCKDLTDDDAAQWLRSGDVRPHLDDWYRLFFQDAERNAWAKKLVEEGLWIKLIREMSDELVVDFKNSKEQLVQELLSCNEAELKALTPQRFLAHTAFAIVETGNEHMSTISPFVENNRYPHNMSWCFDVAFEVIDTAWHDLTREPPSAFFRKLLQGQDGVDVNEDSETEEPVVRKRKLRQRRATRLRSLSTADNPDAHAASIESLLDRSGHPPRASAPPTEAGLQLEPPSRRQHTTEPPPPSSQPPHAHAREPASGDASGVAETNARLLETVQRGAAAAMAVLVFFGHPDNFVHEGVFGEAKSDLYRWVKEVKNVEEGREADQGGEPRSE